MRSPIAVLLAVVAALACAASAAASTVPLRTDGRLPVGFNSDYALTKIWADPAGATPWVAADADAAAGAGATVSRTPLYWRNVQPAKGSWNWGAYDRIIGAYSGRGMRVIVNVSGVPDWAKQSCGTTCVLNPSNLPDFSAFINALANRYGTRLAGIEIFNEPNSSKYWGAAADPEYYTQVLCAGYSGAQSASVRLPVGGGALAPNMANVNGDVRMDQYLSRMLHSGAASCMDAISFHPYPFSTDLTSPTSMFQQEFAQVRALRDYFRPGLPLWVSETGLSLATPGVTQALQAITLPAIYDTIAAMPQHDVDVVVFHTLVQSSGSLGYGLGQLVSEPLGAPLFVPTPGYLALQANFAQGR